MEYQQFVNFLKRHKCYDKFLVLHSKYPNPSQGVYGLSIIDIFKKFPRIVLVMCLSLSSIYNGEGSDAYIFWSTLHLSWMENYV